jgi:hypothetical protein
MKVEGLKRLFSICSNKLFLCAIPREIEKHVKNRDNQIEFFIHRELKKIIA